MALLSANLFFKRNKRYGLKSDFGSITFDILVNERHAFNNDVSVHDIENGSELTDHIRNQLEQGSFTGLITNFSVKTGFIRTNRGQDAFDLIYELWQKKTLVTITTVMKTYTNMAITSIGIARSEGTGDAIVLDISFRKVNQVRLRTTVIETQVNISDMTVEQNRQSAVESDQGRTSPTT